MNPSDFVTLFDVRRDLRYRVDFGTLNIDLTDIEWTYDKSEILVQIQALSHAAGTCRYGILIDFQNDGVIGSGYLLEIPTAEISPEAVQAAQVEILRRYVGDMRREWRKFLDIVGVGEVTGYWDGIKRLRDSVPARRDLVQMFMTNQLSGTGAVNGAWKFMSIMEWLVAHSYIYNAPWQSLPDDLVRASLEQHWFAPVVGQTYRFVTDWAIPYITFFDGKHVGHDPQPGPRRTEVGPHEGNPETFYPFHDFSLRTLGMKGTIQPAGKGLHEIVLAANNYALFGFYAIAMCTIERLRHVTRTRLARYHHYVEVLGAIAGLFMHGAMPATTRFLDDYRRDFDGTVSDGSEKWKHAVEVALGMEDIDTALEFFIDLIEYEDEHGRNKRECHHIEKICAALAISIKSNHAEAAYVDCWQHNWDALGHSLYWTVVYLDVLSSESAWDLALLVEDAIDNPVLDDPDIHVGNPPDLGKYASAMYRSANDLILIFDCLEARSEEIVEVVAEATVKRERQLTNWVRNRGKKAWEINDERVGKLVKYLLGKKGKKKLRSARASITSVAREHLVGVQPMKVTPEQIEKFRKDVIEAIVDDMKSDVPLQGTRVMAPLTAVLSAAVTWALVDQAIENGATMDMICAVLAAGELGVDVGDAYMLIRFKLGGDLSKSARRIVERRLGARVARQVFVLGIGAAVVEGANVITSAGSAYTSFTQGRSKDALLDVGEMSASGVILLGLFGLVSWPILLCAVAVGLTAGLAKDLRWMSSAPEDLCDRLFKNPEADGGIDRFSTWEDEYDNESVVWPVDRYPDPRALTDRIKVFLGDWDTFDNFRK